MALVHCCKGGVKFQKILASERSGFSLFCSIAREIDDIIRTYDFTAENSCYT